jgi:hypothetical protein
MSDEEWRLVSNEGVREATAYFAEIEYRTAEELRASGRRRRKSPGI